MRIAEFIERSNRATTPAGLFALLEQAADDEGFDFLAYALFGASQNLRLSADSKSPSLMFNYPQDWVKHYFDNSYHKVDPVLRLAQETAYPYLWDELHLHFKLNPCERKLMDEACEVSLSAGISVPLHGPHGKLALLSFAKSCPVIEATNQRCRLHAIATQFDLAYTDLTPHARPAATTAISLTRREKECLQWVAQGKSSWDIGVILGISELTATFHIKNAMRKLGTNSRIAAIVRAIRLGCIQL